MPALKFNGQTTLWNNKVIRLMKLQYSKIIRAQYYWKRMGNNLQVRELNTRILDISSSLTELKKDK